MTSESVFVWIWLPGDTQPTLAGRFSHSATAHGAVGRFVYGRSYLQNTDAIPIDPIEVVLEPRQFQTTSLGGVFGAIRDAMPDDWGKYVVDLQVGRQPPIGYLLHTGGDHIGNLGFSRSTGQPPEVLPLPTLSDLETARMVLQGMEAQRPVPQELLRIVRPNTAMGGARPKLTIEHRGKQWIAKFPSQRDAAFPIARVECAMLHLARQCGIDTAYAEVVHEDVLLVERFDRSRVARPDGPGWRRDAFFSAQTVFHANRAALTYGGSYQRLAVALARFSEQIAHDREELFRRMVFNACISNTDDHDRNHGFLASDTPGQYALSPAYDLVPTPHATRRREHALGLGRFGTTASRANLLSEPEPFGLSAAQAEEILRDVESVVQQGWRAALLDHGLDFEQVEHWARCFAPLPQDHIVPGRIRRSPWTGDDPGDTPPSPRG